MPVSTRSQIAGTPSAPNGQDLRAPHLLRNPHHGLKEKMKALTLLYEQHQKLAPKTHSQPLPQKDQEEEEEGKEEEEEKVAKPPTKMPILFPRTESKENQENIIPDHRIAVYSCPKKRIPRKLSMGKGGAMSEGMVVKTKKMEVGTMKEEDGENRSRILVFVRLRPMGKKEKEGGGRSCVRIVNKKDVYLTELASETDYLRLKRVRGRHFCFDLSFPESTTQQEVYSST